MAIVYQFNNASILHLQRQKDMRENALPVLKSKESVLRAEIKNSRKLLEDVRKQWSEALQSEEDFLLLAGEFDTSLVSVDYVETEMITIAGVKVPEIGTIHFKVKIYNLFSNPFWFAGGIDFIKKTTALKLHILYLEKRLFLLENARKKTTQKVNLYEKNQIPEYQEAIRMIKRFLEDEENLSKSAQKILKSKLESEVTS
jgi:V/A-type H+/Na+-transporting ATPase subunit D